MYKRTKAHLVALGALAFSSLIWVGCAFEEGAGQDEAELQTAEELAVDEGGTTAVGSDELEVSDVSAPDAVETSSWGRYCVDQSTASIQYVNPDSCGGFPCGCPSALSPHNEFSRNHPVNVHYECGPYYFVKDLWSTHYGWMRKGALRPC